jgi:hypothetical protein
MERLDELSKLLAASASRRESLRSIGVVLAGAALSPLGLGTAWAARPDRCTAFCRRCSTTKRRNQCLAACRACNGDTSRLCGRCGAYACCATGTACCGGYCADLDNDFDHCGGCGAWCDDPAPYEEGACVGGECVYGCVAGAIICNGRCTDVNSDPANCGACGNVCPASAPFCNHGTCSGCPTGLTFCDPSCVDLSSDAYNCGACYHQCAPNEVCAGGTCQGFE